MKALADWTLLAMGALDVPLYMADGRRDAHTAACGVLLVHLWQRLEEGHTHWHTDADCIAKAHRAIILTLTVACLGRDSVLDADNALPSLKTHLETLNRARALVGQESILVLLDWLILTQDAHWTQIDTRALANLLYVRRLDESTLLLAFERNWRDEARLTQRLKQLMHTTPDISLTITDTNGLNAKQKQAVHMASMHSLTLITGGPGTGKTHTLAHLVRALLLSHPDIEFELAAPTGKAAQRMQEALYAALAKAGMREGMDLPPAKTLHRLLGIGQGAPAHNAQNPLSADLIIIDETSMLGSHLFARLLDAVKPGARVILLGDVNQLAAVDAGAVLADLCAFDGISRINLDESRRFGVDSGIGRLAQACLKGDRAGFLIALGEEDDVSHAPLMDAQALEMTDAAFCQMLFGPFLPFIRHLETVEETDVWRARLFALLGAYRILCTSRHGLGVRLINEAAARYHKAHSVAQVGDWYHGRIVMLTKNHASLGLFNGDVGVVLTHKTPSILFDGHQTPFELGALPLLDLQSAYAMTIHKAQGSEFDAVCVVLDAHFPHLLSRELLYTAITRARCKVMLCCDNAAWAPLFVPTPKRDTGLCEYLNDKTPCI